MKFHSFEDWAKTFDAIFELCTKGKMLFGVLKEHCNHYNDIWSRGLGK